MELSATILWNSFSDKKPSVIFEQAQVDSHVPYFVAFGGKQTTVLIWHARQGKLPQWEWPGGKLFHGDVLFWASQPVAP